MIPAQQNSFIVNSIVSPEDRSCCGGSLERLKGRRLGTSPGSARSPWPSPWFVEIKAGKQTHRFVPFRVGCPEAEIECRGNTRCRAWCTWYLTTEAIEKKHQAKTMEAHPNCEAKRRMQRKPRVRWNTNTQEQGRAAKQAGIKPLELNSLHVPA